MLFEPAIAVRMEHQHDFGSVPILQAFGEAVSNGAGCEILRLDVQMAPRPVETIKKQRLDFSDRRLPFEWRSGSGNRDRNSREIRFPFTRPQSIIARRRT